MQMKISAVLAALAAFAGAATAEAQDIIRLRSGSEVKCKITAMNSQGITFSEAAGKVRTEKVGDILSVELGDKPPSLVKADAAFAEGKYDRAINNLGPALEELAQKKLRELHKQFILFRWAESLALNNKTTEALDMYRRLRNEEKDCWLRASSYQKSMDLARTKGGDAYEALLKEMAAEPEPVGSQAQLELAKIKYTGGDFDSARSGFEKLAANPASPFAGDAKLWSLRCVRSLKKTDELEGLCKKILDDKSSQPPALLQAAGASLADIQLKKSAKDKTKWREILMICIQSIALGPPSGKDEAEDYALALLNGAKCYVLISTDVEKPEAKEEYKTRAVAYYREVQRAYRGTPMSEAATKELVALGEEKPKDAPPPKEK